MKNNLEAQYHLIDKWITEMLKYGLTYDQIREVFRMARKKLELIKK